MGAIKKINLNLIDKISEDRQLGKLKEILRIIINYGTKGFKL